MENNHPNNNALNDMDLGHALDLAFAKAQQDIHSLDERPDNATMLKLYALYKQASKGANTTSLDDFVMATDVSRDDFLTHFPTVMDVLQALNARCGPEAVR